MVYSTDFYRRFDKLGEENVLLKTQLQDSREHCHELNKTVARLKKSKEEMQANYKAELTEKDEIIKALSAELARAMAFLGRDGANTGTPTSRTPIGKTKVIPNSRRSTGRKKGGQPGHEKHGLDAFLDDEINDRVVHAFDGEHECPSCGCTDFEFTGESEYKDETDIKIEVIKRRHEYRVYCCSNCGAKSHVPIENSLKEANQYGSMVQAAALSLMDTGNVPVNKVVTIVSGFTNSQLNLSTGFVAKLQRRASAGLDAFMDDLRLELLTRRIVYWDDTVVMINKSRGCLRFYGDDTIAFYTAHLHKDMDGLDQDKMLQLLSPETFVMHDHNKVNYNEKYRFLNIECNQHLQRDCQKNTGDTVHEWSDELKRLISQTIKDRKDIMVQGGISFGADYMAEFDSRLDRILEKADKEHKERPSHYGMDFEETLLKRIRKHRQNYFLWVWDFTLPTTNNLSERGLRCIKSHQKISGQFESEETAGFYARIKSYIETCRRNGINEIEALIRLSDNNPFTVAEIFPPN
jgi:transcription elongation factor Elf1